MTSGCGRKAAARDNQPTEDISHIEPYQATCLDLSNFRISTVLEVSEADEAWHDSFYTASSTIIYFRETYVLFPFQRLSEKSRLHNSAQTPKQHDEMFMRVTHHDDDCPGFKTPLAL